MKPIIAIVGRPNVGKSTFFNRLTSSRDALVVDRPGVTRDCQYHIAHHNGKRFLVVDTGGIGEEDHDSKNIAKQIAEKSMKAANDASVLIFIADGRVGLTHVDEILVKELRKLDKPIFLIVNKLEGDDTGLKISEFFSLGFDLVWPISAQRGDGIMPLMDSITKLFPDRTEYEEKQDIDVTTISVLGRPNAGKSTLINYMIGEDRLLTSNYPGTTRDSIRIPFQKDGKKYILIDTAGVRRKSKIHDIVEKFSILKSFDAIEIAKIIILVIDASEGITEQDSTLLGMLEDSGKSVIIAINKWDLLDTYHKEKITSDIKRKFNFIDYADYHYISALHGIGINNLFKSMNRIERSKQIDVSTSDMTKILESATSIYPPQMVRGRRIKLRYAHIGAYDPIRIIIHGNQTNSIPNSYTKYLSRFFRKSLELIGTPVIIVYKHSHNPFKNKKNKSMPR